MGMIARYKKKGGFLQLLQLLETSGLKKREQFLALIKEESPAWEQALSSKILTIEKVFSWDPATLQEIFTRCHTLTLVTVLKNRSPEVRTMALTAFSMADKKRILEQIDNSSPNPIEISTCELKLLTEIRTLVVSGHVKLEKIDPELAVSDDIENELGNEVSASAAASTASDVQAVEEEILKSASKPSPANNAGDEEFKKKLILLSKEIQNLRAENAQLKDKLDRIKKIA